MSKARFEAILRRLGPPRWRDDRAAIYLGDCRRLLLRVPADRVVMVTDPPYGVAYTPTRNDRRTIAGDSCAFDPTPLARFPRAAIFGANHFADRLPMSSAWIVWDKRKPGHEGKWAQGDAELLWTTLPSTATRLIRAPHYSTQSALAKLHPTVKPQCIMRPVIERMSRRGEVIIDPYMGSGSTLVAAKATGRFAVGFELDPGYCRSAIRRLRACEVG